MLKDEFIRVTGVTVSQKYFDDVIEPSYLEAGTVSKLEWLHEWAAANAAQTVTAMLDDIKTSELDAIIAKDTIVRLSKAKETLSRQYFTLRQRLRDLLDGE